VLDHSVKTTVGKNILDFAHSHYFHPALTISRIVPVGGSKLKSLRFSVRVKFPGWPIKGRAITANSMYTGKQITCNLAYSIKLANRNDIFMSSDLKHLSAEVYTMGLPVSKCSP
jgi:hypothetical protein